MRIDVHGPWIVGVRGVEPLALPGLLPAGLHPARVVQRLHLGRHGAPSLRRRRSALPAVSAGAAEEDEPEADEDAHGDEAELDAGAPRVEPVATHDGDDQQPQRHGDEDGRLFLDLPRDQPWHGSERRSTGSVAEDQ